MRIAVMAAGGVGGYFGAKLAAAGHDVIFIARGAHRDAIARNGLVVESVNGNLHVRDAKVTDDPATAGAAEIVLFAVKLWDTETAAAASGPMLGPDTRVITLQNGVDSYERIAPLVGAERAVPGVTYVATVIDRPGVIRQDSKAQSIICGTIDGRPDRMLETFVAAAQAAGIDIALSRNIQLDRWQKFVLLSATSGATSVTRSSIGPILADPDLRAMFANLMRETVKVGQAKGVPLADDYPEERIAFMEKNMPPSMKASMANDLDRGNRLELDWLGGAVSRMGSDVGVPTPVNDTIYAALKLYRMGKR